MSLILVSVLISFVNAYLPQITRKVSLLFVKKRDKSSLKTEIEETIAELKSISARHEFPKYARLKRKLNKLNEERQNEEKSYQTEYSQAALKVSYIFQGILTAVSLLMFWLYRFKSVGRLDEDWVYPLGNVLSWPLLSSGEISFPVWFLISNSVSKIVASSF